MGEIISSKHQWEPVITLTQSTSPSSSSTPMAARESSTA